MLSFHSIGEGCRFVPTLFDFAGLSCDVKVDGVSFRDVVTNQGTLPKRPLFWASLSNNGQRSEAMRLDEWKLVVLHPKAAPGTFENSHAELDNLSLDPSEAMAQVEDDMRTRCC